MKSYDMSIANYPVLNDMRIETIPFFRNYVNFMMVFFPITSFLVIPAIQGTTIITVLAFLLVTILVAFPAGANKWKFFKEFLIFLMVFAVFSIVSQYLNLICDIRLTDRMLLVVEGQYMKYFYRISHLTQALYIIIAYLIYLSVKYYADRSVIKYIYWGLRLLCVYGIYEIIFFFVTGTKGDFIANREFGESAASLTQTAPIAGLSKLIRMKSATGEPSMFTFTVFPFWALTYGLRRKFDRNLLSFCLILTFSTTAYGAMVLFLFCWFIYKKRYTQIIYVLVGLLIVLAISQMDAFRDKFNSVYDFVFGDKFESASSRGRGGRLEYHATYWAELNPWSKAFGIGFGYIRSTDFFTTVLVNNGWLGFLTFTGFFFYNRSLKNANKDLAFAYFTGLAILFFIMMATVPEFAYPSLWIYLALSFIINKFFHSEPPSVKEHSIDN